MRACMRVEGEIAVSREGPVTRFLSPRLWSVAQASPLSSLSVSQSEMAEPRVYMGTFATGHTPMVGTTAIQFSENTYHEFIEEYKNAHGMSERSRNKTTAPAFALGVGVQ